MREVGILSFCSCLSRTMLLSPRWGQGGVEVQAELPGFRVESPRVFCQLRLGSGLGEWRDPGQAWEGGSHCGHPDGDLLLSCLRLSSEPRGGGSLPSRPFPVFLILCREPSPASTTDMGLSLCPAFGPWTAVCKPGGNSLPVIGLLSALGGGWFWIWWPSALPCPLGCCCHALRDLQDQV